ncbi:hypothetical protein AVEN_112105-1 [Araneus ventricosus]|uniref:Uncharacterized protein n=1 Tax=Araneus ventricosus TaxID=182803 RepID=A0A4Y2PRJ8_ARAVE|nr:hypothetical protein AVEN_261288-1 [Araneus ventricosus]GBN54528.1 hypothetical protein AVEN_112105-1 [Araneus ventricosus]
MGRHAQPTRGGDLLSMRNKKQTERQLLLMESSLAYPRGKEENSKKLKWRQKQKEKKTLGYLWVVNPVTSISKPENGFKKENWGIFQGGKIWKSTVWISGKLNSESWIMLFTLSQKGRM